MDTLLYAGRFAGASLDGQRAASLPAEVRVPPWGSSSCGERRDVPGWVRGAGQTQPGAGPTSGALPAVRLLASHWDAPVPTPAFTVLELPLALISPAWANPPPPHPYSRNDSVFSAAGTNEGPGPHPSARHRQELVVRGDGGDGVVLQEVGQLGVGAPLPQDHVPPVWQLVQDKVPAAIPSPAGRGDGVGTAGGKGTEPVAPSDGAGESLTYRTGRSRRCSR